MSDFVIRKNVQFFYLADYDRDGVVERDDFSAAGARIASALGFTAGSSSANACVAAIEGFWGTYWAGADSDNDGRVTLFEWLGWQQGAAQDPEKMRAMHFSAHNALFNAMDQSGDGTVSAKEYLAFTVEGLKVPRAAAEAAFPVIDTDGDGKLSREEFPQLIWEYHMSADPSSAGNQFYGGY